MRANKLTNSIYSILNEDKFAKYTLQQIFDELDEEDFSEYLSNTALKIIRTLDEKFKAVKPKIINKTGHNHLTITFYVGKDGFDIRYGERFNVLYIQCDYNKFMIYGHDIDGDKPNFSTRLKEEIIRCFNKVKELK